MRIVILLNDLQLGGAERQALHLAAGLRERGHDASVAALGEPGPLRDTCARAGVPCEARPLTFALSPCYAPLNLARTARFLRRLRPDAVAAFTGVPNLYGALTWRWAGAGRFVWNQRSAGLYRPNRLLERLAVRSTRLFAANATSAVDFLVRDLRVPREAVHRIPNGVALPARPGRTGQWRRKLGAADTDVVACMVGNVRAPKDHAGLLDAWKLVRRRGGAGGVRAHLWLIGRVHADGEAVRRRETEPELAGSVRFLGFQEDVAGVLADADIGVFASRSEGQPNGVLECMAAGLPVVATDLPGVRDCVEGDQTAYLSEIGDPHALAEGILCLAADPAERRRLGAANRRRIEREFSIAAMVERTLALMARSGSCPQPENVSQRRGDRGDPPRVLRLRESKSLW
jgi:glycosyltransferase involved in cell wall biosynthesis